MWPEASQAPAPVLLSRLLVDDARSAGAPVAFGRAGTYDFADFRARVAALAAAVSDAGRGPWLLYATDAYAFTVSLAALVYSGSTAVLAPNAQPGTLAELATRTRGRLLPSGLARQVESALPTLDPMSVAAGATATFEAPDRVRPVIELFTSGTTGSGKPVTKALAHLEDEVAVLERRFGASLGPATRIFSTVSCQHLYGLLFRVLWPLATGRPFQADTLLRPEELLPRMLETGDCALVATPVHLRRLGAPAGVEPLRSVCRAVFSSGGPLAAETAAAVSRGLGAAAVEIFGSTETGGVAWRRRDAGGARDGSAWTPLDGVCIDREPVTGRLVVRSPFVSTGEPSGKLGGELAGQRNRARAGDLPADSAGRPAGDRVANRAGELAGEKTGGGPDRRALLTFTMGDCVRLLPDGGFELLGRSDRVVKVGEKRLALPDMERHLLSHPLVAAAVVLPFEQAGVTRLRAVVGLGDAGRKMLGEDGHRAFAGVLRDHLAPYFDRVLLPRAWRFVDALPRDAQGKTTLALLAALFENKPAAAAAERAASGSAQHAPPREQAAPSFPIVRNERRGERTLERRLHVPADLTFLEGHFDGFPIVAGVVQVHWVMSAARELLGYDPQMRAMEALKFKELLTPGQDFDLKVEVNASHDRVDFLLSDDARVFSSGRCLLAPPRESAA